MLIGAFDKVPQRRHDGGGLGGSSRRHGASQQLVSRCATATSVSASRRLLPYDPHLPSTAVPQSPSAFIVTDGTCSCSFPFFPPSPTPTLALKSSSIPPSDIFDPNPLGAASNKDRNSTSFLYLSSPFSSPRLLVKVATLALLVLGIGARFFDLDHCDTSSGGGFVYPRRIRPLQPTNRWTAHRQPREIFSSSGCCKAISTYLPRIETEEAAMAPIGSNSLLARAEAISKEFEYSAEDVRKGVKEFLRLMDVGLQNDGQAMTMIPTYVTSVPNGTEKGVYLAVDLGGTNFRVCSVNLSGDSKFILTQSKAAIPKWMMTSDSHTLFSFLAQQVKLFVEEHHGDHFAETPDHHLQLGFTFSFPVDQRAVNKGYLIRWTKGFDIADAIGKDVCELLQKEIDVLGIPVTVAALVNDTVGTLMARSYTSPGETGTLLGAIFGTGTNGAYLEKLSKITKMTNPDSGFGEYDKSTGEMVVNIEWGSFDNSLAVLPDTPYDRQLDKNSVNPGIQMLEKRISGMFLGEILRNAILGLKQDVDLFSTAEIKEDAALNTPWSVDTSVLSYIEADDSEDLAKAKSVLEEQLGVPAAHVSTEEARAVKILAHAIGKRSARLSAVPIAAVLIATGKVKQSEPLVPMRSLSLLEQVIQAIKSVFIGRPPVVDVPATGTTVRSDKDVATTKEELEVIDIGVDGSVVEFYPGFEDLMREALRDVPEVGAYNERRIRMGVAKDGSGVGAALIALVAAKMAGIPTAVSAVEL